MTFYYYLVYTDLQKTNFSSGHKSSASTTSAVVVVETTELLEEDEGENRVWSKTSIVRSEALPQTEETFIFDQPGQNILLREENRNGIMCCKMLLHMYMYTIIRGS